MLEKTLKRLRRKVRVRSQIHGTAECPRLSVFRSNTGIYAQVIDDDKGVTLAAYSDLKLEKTGTKTNSATTVWSEVAKLALAKDVKRVVFDRNGFAYHGRVKALAEAAREAGLKF